MYRYPCICSKLGYSSDTLSTEGSTIEDSNLSPGSEGSAHPLPSTIGFNFKS